MPTKLFLSTVYIFMTQISPIDVGKVILHKNASVRIWGNYSHEQYAWTGTREKGGEEERNLGEIEEKLTNKIKVK